MADYADRPAFGRVFLPMRSRLVHLTVMERHLSRNNVQRHLGTTHAVIVSASVFARRYTGLPEATRCILGAFVPAHPRKASSLICSVHLQRGPTGRLFSETVSFFRCTLYTVTHPEAKSWPVENSHAIVEKKLSCSL